MADAAEAETWVWDPSMESLSIVNEILCYVQQIGAKELVNGGGNSVLINEDKCRKGENQSAASSGGAQSASASATSVEYNNWTVISTRADNDSPQRVKIWIPGERSDDPMDAQHILVKTSISAYKPFGTFVLNYRAERQLQRSTGRCR